MSDDDDQFDEGSAAIKILGNIMKFITEYIPWWVFLIVGFLVAIFVPLLV